MNLLFLLTLHHLADCAFQPDWMIRLKHKHLFTIYEHAFIWAGTISVGLYLLGNFALWKFFWLIVGHFLIDAWKYRQTEYEWTYLDQTAHYLQVVVVWV